MSHHSSFPSSTHPLMATVSSPPHLCSVNTLAAQSQPHGFCPSPSFYASFSHPFQILFGQFALLPPRSSLPPTLLLLLILLFFLAPLLSFSTLLLFLSSLKSACGLTEMQGSDGGCQTVSTYLFSNIHTCTHLACSKELQNTRNKKKCQEHKQSIECIHITEFHLNFHAFISSKYVFQACCQKKKAFVDSQMRFSWHYNWEGVWGDKQTLKPIVCVSGSSVCDIVDVIFLIS